MRISDYILAVVYGHIDRKTERSCGGACCSGQMAGCGTCYALKIVTVRPLAVIGTLF